ncbi:Predicted arabinose efflux permease, MFS family [Jatrophihabitans endophyticus]|uniref:Predicted arabinose efflux permease, MFS family n=1 Tax=Jatrophihabitans endophyticus TaxID=1206085 RepID=A0A1M5IWD8_9ACTN|nr:MFS transporter [Jatrophihabitans endophyticus]SHG32637.1 Predicted arabinose efflux permease, MFS family [Jatrophihabitans endophyticus]
MSTYRTLAANREFRALWISSACTTAAAMAAGLALAFLVHEATGSATLTALTMFGPSLAQLLGASTLMSLADSAPPRRALLASNAVVTAVLVAQAALDLSPLVRLALMFGAAVALSVGAGIRWGLVQEVLPHESYGLARSAMNLAGGAFQIVGFAVGGLLLSALDIRSVFLVAAATSAAGVAVVGLAMAERPPRRAARGGLGETWRGNRALLGDRATRVLLIALVLPNGLVVGCEALFVPLFDDLAGWVYAAAALGMMAGDLLVGRVLTAAARRRAATALRLLLAMPFVVFVVHPPVLVAAGLAAVAAVGYGASLVQQEHLVALTPPHLRGQTLGVESSARLSMQGVCALLAGVLADRIGAGVAVGLLAGASVLVSLVLTPALARIARSASALPA